MSAILFNNPFAAPPPAAYAVQPGAAGLGLAPVGATQASQDSATRNNSGSGSETGKQAETVALFQKKQSFERPATATSDSVVNAQARPPEGLPGAAAKEEIKLGPDLPEVDLPDPLPTSPFLLQLREAK